MFKIITIIGARPQIIKAAAISRAIKNNFSGQIRELIVHTGQHYDENMSNVFFTELGIPQPDYNLNVGSGSHAKQTAAMLTGIEEIIFKEKPNCIVLYGDTNSTLAGAVAASKEHLPVVHIEAGLRSYNKAMPEEINRIICDHVSTLLFSPTKAGYANLLAEGFKDGNVPPFTIDNPKIFHCGDIMFDNSLFFSELADSKTSILSDHHLEKNKFILTTIHRNNNTDEPARLNALFSAINKITKDNNIKAALPLHPRTSKLMEQNLTPGLLKEIRENKLIIILPPVSFLEMIALEKNSRLVMTDSGGVQKEAYFFKKPCIVLRAETEWVELIENGNNILADADEKKILEAYNFLGNNNSFTYPPIFGDGKASEFICTEMLQHLSK